MPEASQLQLGTIQLRRQDPGRAVYRRDAMPRPPRPIHPRRVIPQVPRGVVRPDNAPSQAAHISGAATLGRGQPHALAAADALTISKNVELTSTADNNAASHVGEPSVASNGNVIFYTGNWYAALSSDGGNSFQYVDPYHSFPNPHGMEFCCDQVALYLSKIDTFVWLMQYTEQPAGGNIQRLAFAKTVDVVQGTWRLYDIEPDSLGFPNAFLDFPDLAVGSNHLYATTNIFPGNADPTTAIVRIPLADILSDSISAEHAVSQDHFSFRVAQNCGERAFWACHQDTSTLRLFSWDEGAGRPNFEDIPVASWDHSDYRSRTPTHVNWLGRADPRLTGATCTGAELWFAWGAGRGGINHRPHPYVQIARVRVADLHLVEDINIWDPSAAVCYAALGSNAQNEVATSYMMGGGTMEPSHVVGFLTAPQEHVLTAEGSRAPTDQQWGDYLTVRPRHPIDNTFCATGYTLKETQNPSNSDATPRFIVFGRSEHVPHDLIA
jgi:hypothetical protein